MKFSDPFTSEIRPPSESVISVGLEYAGADKILQSRFLSFGDECLVIADNKGGVSHGDLSASLTAETALWGYKQIRQRRFYWNDKEKLVDRIFRSTNIALWQKHREAGFEAGLASSLSVLIVTPQRFFTGSVGDNLIYLYREGLIDTLTTPDVDGQGNLTRMIGVKRYGLVSQITNEPFLTGDVLLLATRGLHNFLDEEDLRAALECSGTTRQSLMEVANHLIQTALENGCIGSAAVGVVKKIV